MNRLDRTQVEQLFAAFVTRDLDALMAQFAEEAIVFDPHYPAPLMTGKSAIRSGFEWAFGVLRQPGFTIRNFWVGENNAAIEVDTHHVTLDGLDLKFPQVFVLEWRDGLIARLQAYGPYPPLPPGTEAQP